MFPLPVHARDALTYLSGWPRRAAALLCLVAAAVSAVAGRHRPADAGTATVVARRSIPAGSVIHADQLTVAEWPPEAVPADAARSVDALVGKRVAATLPAGLPISPASLLEPAMAAAVAAGQVSTTVQLGDAGQLAIVHPGARVDLYPRPAPSGLPEPGSSGSPIQPIVRAALVLSVVPASDDAADAGPTLVIAIDRKSAGELASHPAGSLLATLVPPP